MLLALIFFSLPKVNGKPLAFVLSNFKPAPVSLMVKEVNVSPDLSGENVIVKKFGSREEALVLLPKPVTVAFWGGFCPFAMARQKKGSISCGLSTLPCKTCLMRLGEREFGPPAACRSKAATPAA